MPITAEQAWAATDPSQTQEQREMSAQAIIQGVTANDAYLESRGELEKLKALAAAPQVVTHESLNTPAEELPTGDDIQTVEGTAEEESRGSIGSEGDSGSGTEKPEDVLRQQLINAGIQPKV